MEGKIFSYIHFNGQIGSLVKITTQTDFAAKTDEFKEFGNNIAMQVAVTNPQTISELLEQPFFKIEELSIRQYLDRITKILGEYVNIVQFQMFSIK